jgi:hypothetical protein
MANAGPTTSALQVLMIGEERAEPDHENRQTAILHPILVVAFNNDSMRCIPASS